MVDSPFLLHADIPPLGRDEIHVWMIEAPIGTSTRSLSAFSQDKLGRLLASYANCRDAPVILRGEHGKPYAPDLDGIEFNLSHSGRHALIAIARDQAIGIDIEAQGRRRSINDIAERFFAPAESRALRALPEEARDAAFLRLWTGKEAVLKALGEGLSFGLDRVEFELDEHGQLGALLHVASSTSSTDGWNWRALRPLEDYHAAIAWHGPPRRLRLLRAP
ncbi:MAG: 4'-phosphopantetheinyl transferase superfamily protein [Dokdonella sp.]